MFRVFFTTAVLAFASSVTTAETITVCLDGACDYSDIQSAISAASDGDVIEIAAGTYYPAATINTLGKAVTLRGEVGKGKDDAPTTVIDGQNSIQVLECDIGEGADTVFENLVITGGQAMFGGGMRCTSSSPTLVNCVFQQNSGTDSFGYGGGMNCNDSSPTLVNCVFKENSALSNGGDGMYCAFSNPTITNSVSQQNSGPDSYGYGGGMYCKSNSNPTLINCVFQQNSAIGTYGLGGGMACVESSPTLTNCLFQANAATDGGGMHFFAYSSPTLTNCVFQENSSTGNGGGMTCTLGSNPTITNCVFEQNSATGNGGGGMHIYINAYPRLIGCMFCGNAPNQIDGNWSDEGGNCVQESCDDCQDCVGDLNNDGEVNGQDLGVLFVAWGQCCPTKCYVCPEDFNTDGEVNGQDLGLLFVAWGACP